MTTTSLGDWLPLLLVTFAVALACDALLTARSGFSLDLPEREDPRVFRLLNLGLGLAFGIYIATRRRPDQAFGATAVWALVGPAIVLVGAAVRARRHRDPEVPGPRIVDTATSPTLGSLISWPLQVLHVGAVVVTCLFFRWTLPHLPSVAPVHWSGDGNVYTSPTRLWWSLAIVAFNTAIILFAAFAARGPGQGEEPQARALDVQRRALGARLVEVLLVGLDLIAMGMWALAIIALLPGQSRGVAPAGALTAGGLAALLLGVAIALYGPALLRLRRAQRSPTAK